MAENANWSRKGLFVLWSRLKPFVRPYRGLYFATVLLSLLTLGTALSLPLMIRGVIDQGIQTGNMNTVYFWITAMACLLAVQVVATYFRAYLLEIGSERVSANIRNWLFSRIVQHELTFFDIEDTGNLTARVTGDVGALQRTLGHLFPDSIQAILRFVIAGGLMLYTSLTLSAVVLIVGPLLWFGSSMQAKLIRNEAAKIRTKSSILFGRISEVLRGILTVQVYHQEEQAVAQHEMDSDNVVTTSKPLIRARALLEAYTNLFSEGAVILAIWVGAILITGNSLTPGALVTFILYAGLVTRAATSLSHAGAELMQAQGATNRVFEIGERETQMPYVHGETPGLPDGKIELENVHFSYPTRSETAALHGISFKIDGGEEVALVGVSGCGKSTIAKLISKLYAPKQGRIRIDGYDLNELDTEWLRETITLIPPEPVIFSSSVADNIRYGRPDATDSEVYAAAHTAHATEFIEALPQGYDTVAGDNGRLFSSGQRQRIAIARAVLRGPKILILDESTAALDTQSEAIVKESLRKLPQQPTLILISHRLSTIVDAPRLIVLDRGMVIAEGSHNELMATSNFYQELVQDQLVRD